MKIENLIRMTWVSTTVIMSKYYGYYEFVSSVEIIKYNELQPEQKSPGLFVLPRLSPGPRR